ncbi:MAG: glutamate 5-kinase [Pseudomonadota bacterium]
MSLGDAKRLIIKVGSALLVDEVTGKLRRAWLEALADDIAHLRENGMEVVVVSSGAIALGRRILGLDHRTISLADKQAAAATGQIMLSQVWQEALGRNGLIMAQVLVTLEDMESRRRYLNARATLNALLGRGAIPLINENDTVATEEIRFGDNDRLGAKVAHMISADTLVLLSDIDGLYTADPRKNPDATLIPVVRDLTPEIMGMAGKAPTMYSSGGMVTKLQAAEIAMKAGCRMIIARGTLYHPLKAQLDGGPHTLFLPSESPLAARRHWIATSLSARGAIVVDAGAVKALRAGKNLLPAGITAVEGGFKHGDAVRVLDAAGIEIARAITAYSADETRQIKGHGSQDIEPMLGYSRGNAVIHSDDLVMFDPL